MRSAEAASTSVVWMWTGPYHFVVKNHQLFPSPEPRHAGANSCTHEQFHIHKSLHTVRGGSSHQSRCLPQCCHRTTGTVPAPLQPPAAPVPGIPPAGPTDGCSTVGCTQCFWGRLLHHHHSTARSGSALCPPHGCHSTDTRTILYVNNFQVQLLIINTDSSEGKSKRHLAVRTFNESAIKELRRRGMVLLVLLADSCLPAPLPSTKQKDSVCFCNPSIPLPLSLY